MHLKLLTYSNRGLKTGLQVNENYVLVGLFFFFFFKSMLHVFLRMVQIS